MSYSNNEDQRLLDKPASASASVAASTTNISLVTITVRNSWGRVIPYSAIIVYLSDSAVGAANSGTTASGAVTVGATGALLGTLTTKQTLLMQAGSAGTLILSITDSAKTAFKVCAIIDGLPTVLATLATASYG